VLAKLREKLAGLLKTKGIQTAFRDRAVRRMTARHNGQVRAEKQAEAAREKADALRAEAAKCFKYGPTENVAKGERLRRRAERKDAKALRFDAKAEKEKARAVEHRGAARRRSKSIEKTDDSIETIEKQIAKFGPTVKGNTVTGDDEFEVWLLCLNTAALNCSKGLPEGRRNFYSMSGGWDVDHPLHPGEAPGERSDCSQTQTAFMKSCGFPDINGTDFTGGFTGTMVQAHGRWKEVSLQQMLAARRPAVIVYGWGDGHHTEGWCPTIDADGNFIDSMRTVGHGSAPVDAGTVFLFGSGERQRYFILAKQ